MYREPLIPVAVAVDHDMLEMLQMIALREMRSLSQVMRLIVMNYLRESEPEIHAELIRRRATVDSPPGTI